MVELRRGATCLRGDVVELKEVAVGNGFQGGVVHLAMSSALAAVNLGRRTKINNNET